MFYRTFIICLCLLACKNPQNEDTDSDTDSDTDLEDTDQVGPCATPTVTFQDSTGSSQDLTDYFLSGEYITLGLPGTITACPGTWFVRILLRADIEVIGLGENPRETIFSGGESGTILDIAGPDVRVTVDNLTLDRGAGLDVSHNSGGGAIYCEQNGHVDVTRVQFTNNFANDGAAMYGRNCVFTVSDTHFEDNVSEDDGGAVTLWDSSATFTDVTLKNNSALDGGAMALFNSELTASNMSVIGNRATNFGAGIWAYDSVTTLNDVTFDNNLSEGSDYGGGLIVFGTATLNRVSFNNNTAPLGGGLYVYYDGVVDGTNCSFNGNAPEDIFAANYSASGGESYMGSTNYSFRCAENTCTPK